MTVECGSTIPPMTRCLAYPDMYKIFKLGHNLFLCVASSGPVIPGLQAHFQLKARCIPCSAGHRN